MSPFAHATKETYYPTTLPLARLLATSSKAPDPKPSSPYPFYALYARSRTATAVPLPTCNQQSKSHHPLPPPTTPDSLFASSNFYSFPSPREKQEERSQGIEGKRNLHARSHKERRKKARPTLIQLAHPNSCSWDSTVSLVLSFASFSTDIHGPEWRRARHELYGFSCQPHQQ